MVGEDTDVLVLLIHYVQEERHNLTYTSEAKAIAIKTTNIMDHQKCQAGPGRLGSQLFALSGCDTTSHLHGIGKALAFEKNPSEPDLNICAQTFNSLTSTRQEIEKALDNVQS